MVRVGAIGLFSGGNRAFAKREGFGGGHAGGKVEIADMRRVWLAKPAKAQQYCN
jgi:hypothetical protein